MQGRLCLPCKACEEVKMKEELVSVIVLSYNNLHGIYETLDSVFRQTYGNIEVIVSDDGSKGFSEEALKIKKYIALNAPSSITNVVFNEIAVNRGTVKNINSAIALSKGSIIKVLSSEDKLSHENVIERYVGFLSSTEYEICFAKMRGVTGGGAYLYHLASCEDDYDLLKKLDVQQTENRLYRRNFLPAPAWCAKRSLFQRFGLFPESVRLIEDYPYWCHLAQSGVRFGYIDEVMIDYRLSGVSSAGTYSEHFMQDMFKIYDEYIFPNDRRFGVVQPVYNYLKRSGLRYYYERARWAKMTLGQKIVTSVVFAPFFALTFVQDLSNRLKNKG